MTETSHYEPEGRFDFILFSSVFTGLSCRTLQTTITGFGTGPLVHRRVSRDRGLRKGRTEGRFSLITRSQVTPDDRGPFPPGQRFTFTYLAEWTRFDSRDLDTRIFVMNGE